MKQKYKFHICRSLFVRTITPIKCVCGSSTECRVLRKESLWRHHEEENLPYFQWFCKTTGNNISYCSIELCHTTLIGKYENHYRIIQKHLKEMWDILQHFSGLEGR